MGEGAGRALRMVRVGLPGSGIVGEICLDLGPFVFAPDDVFVIIALPDAGHAQF